MSTSASGAMTFPGGPPTLSMDDLPRLIDRPPPAEVREPDAVDHAAESLRRAALVSGGRNPVFALLVEHDDDMVGLVAYALYKQSKRDWMEEFATRNGRGPTDDEVDSYILGERTARRVATYRRLAADALDRFKPQRAAHERAPAREPLAPDMGREKPRGFIEQAQIFLMSASIGAVAALVGVYGVPRLLAP